MHAARGVSRAEAREEPCAAERARREGQASGRARTRASRSPVRPQGAGLRGARATVMFCQVCGLKNRDDEEFCSRCHSKLLVLSGVGVVEEGGETQEEIPFDEHLLERISTLEDVVKRTGEAVKTLFESRREPREEPVRRAHGHPGPPGDARAPRFAVRPEEVFDLWETKMDERMHAVEKKDRFLEWRDRIVARFAGERARRAPSAPAGGRVRDPRSGRGARRPAARGAVPRSTARTPTSASTSARRSSPPATSRRRRGFFKQGAGRRAEPLRVAASTPESRRPRAARPRAAEALLRRAIDRRPDAFLPHFALGALYAHAVAVGRGGAGAAARARRRPRAVGARAARHGAAREGRRGPRDRAVRGGARDRARPRRTRCSSSGSATSRRTGPSARSSASSTRSRRTRSASSSRRRCACSSGGAAYALPRVDGPGAEAYPAGGGAASRAARCAGRTTCISRPSRPSPHNPTIRISYALLCASLGALEGSRSRRAARSSTGSRRTSSRPPPARRSRRRFGRRASSDEAARFVRDFLQRHPSKTAQTVGYYELATSLAESGEDLDSALDYAGRALSAAPDELKPYPLAALGWVHYKRREFDRAIDCLRRSSERAAAPTTLHHLGMAYLAAGKPEEAKAAFTPGQDGRAAAARWKTG